MPFSASKATVLLSAGATNGVIFPFSSRSPESVRAPRALWNSLKRNFRTCALAMRLCSSLVDTERGLGKCLGELRLEIQQKNAK